MAWFETLGLTLTSNLFGFWILGIIATALWGDATFVVLMLLSFQFKIPLFIALSASLIGTLLGDTIWYLLGVKMIGKLKQIKKIEKNYLYLENALNRIFKKKYLLTLIIVKFLYGTRIVTIIYLANNKLKYKKFLIYDIIATIIWIATFTGITYLVSIGFTFILTTFKNIQLAISFVILSIIILNIIQKIITEKVKNKNNKK